MEPLLDAAFVNPWWVGFVIVIVLLLLLLGYTIGSSVIGFGPRVVRRTETFEYGEEEAKNRAPEKQGQPNKRSITTETQTSRTLWDWLTVLTISAVIGVVALMFTSRQAVQQRYIQNQQTMDATLQAYLDQMTEMMLDDKAPLLDSGSESAAVVAARVRTVTALKRLDGEHNEIVTTFLKESGLVNFRLPGGQRKTC